MSETLSEPAVNTDREIYREPDESGNSSYYSDSVSVTPSGGICINVGGHVICRSLKEWHAAVRPSLPGANLSAIAEAIHKGRHVPNGVPYKPLTECTDSDRDYCYRLARAVVAVGENGQDR